MPEREKIDAVRRYLENEFPGHTIHAFQDLDREAHSFRIDRNGVSHLATVAEEFLGDFSSEKISSLLHQFQLADTLRAVGRERVLVTSHGLQYNRS